MPVNRLLASMRWIWIDRFIDFQPGKQAVAVKNVSLAEEHLHDHWPAFPTLPHSLVIEGVAQTAGLLVGHVNNFEHDVILAKISRADFEDIVVPGDRLEYKAQITNITDQAASTENIITKNGKPFGEVNIMFSHANNAMQQLDLPDKFVFTGSFRRLVETFLEEKNG